jgi:hypothetical protein
LYDLRRNIRAVGKAYKQLIHDWREVLPTQSVCLRVPIEGIEKSDRLQTGVNSQTKTSEIEH